MNKIKKIILTTILILMISIISYMTIDSIRLRNSSCGTKPLITTEEKITENRAIYSGVGYKIKYYLNSIKEENSNHSSIKERCYGAEYRVFNNILIWAWVE